MDSAEVVADMIDVVWRLRELDVLSRYWTEGCVNHAAPEGSQAGLQALTAYHRDFADQLAGFADVRVEIMQQLVSIDRVATQLRTCGSVVDACAPPSV